ncbi:MAG: hypothetical protein B6D63_04385, partial [Candidatus Latescibacteria bacterium 4484_7]
MFPRLPSRPTPQNLSPQLKAIHNLRKHARHFHRASLLHTIGARRRFFATYDWGKEASMPCWPEGRSSGYGLGGAPVNGYGFGIEADYRPMRDMAFTFDI